MTDAEFLAELERRGIGPGRLHAVEASDGLDELGERWDLVDVSQTVTGGGPGTIHTGWVCRCAHAGEHTAVDVGGTDGFKTAAEAINAALEES